MSRGWQDPAWVEMMLEECSTWAVVGLSGDPSRTAYSIASLLQQRGKRIVPVHPAAAGPGGLEVLGERAFASLSDIDVPSPRGRAGYLVSQALNDALATRPGASGWRLDLDLSEQRFPRGLRVDNVATRYEYVLTAAYTLRAGATGEPAKTGRVRVELTYDSADQPYASITAQQDAQERAAAEAARRIQLELAAWFADQAEP